jgi:hypothetical protein
MEYVEAWYWCILEDSSAVEARAEPDWSRVPEIKREMIREKWLKMNEPKPYSERVKLWGPQIPFFMKQPYYTVQVLELVS